MPARLSNTSALGIFRFEWRSALDDAQCSVAWGDGLYRPIATMNGMSVEVREPGRFGFARPVTLKNFREFAQQFADEFEDI